MELFSQVGIGYPVGIHPKSAIFPLQLPYSKNQLKIWKLPENNLNYLLCLCILSI